MRSWCIPRIVGCRNELATNYFVGANVDSGDCHFPGCTSSTRANFDAQKRKLLWMQNCGEAGIEIDDVIVTPTR